MAAIDNLPADRALRSPVRNRYFYGKLLDVYHFQLETDYMNAKRHLLNRLVSGYGVVCGLDVQPGTDGRHVVVTPGVAIDKWGREIVVPEPTSPVAIPAHLLPPERAAALPPEAEGADARYGEDRKPRYEEDEEERVVRVVLCYHECESDPTPVMAGDCGTVEECAAGAVRERYRIAFREGAAPRKDLQCRVPDLFRGDRLDYEALARHISQGCPEPPRDPCITLANVRLAGPEGHGCDPERIDITVRPIVYTNDLLLEIFLSFLEEGRGGHGHAAK